MKYLLITDDIARQYADAIRNTLGAPCELVVVEASTDALPDNLDRAELAFLSLDLMGGKDAEGPNPRLRAYSRAVEQAGALRWIHTQAAGADRPVLQNALARGVTVTTSSGASAQAVAHTAIAGMLALARNVPGWLDAQAKKVWAPPARAQWPRDIDGSRALVIGTGPIGQAIGRICGAMGVHVTGVRRNVQPMAEFADVIDFAGIPSVLPQVDWLFLACPLTPLTRGLVDAEFLRHLPPHAGVVNIARGEVIVDDAMQTALRNERLLGYYSDVFAGEPLAADSPWWEMPRTIMSPHLAAASQDYGHRTVESFLDNLGRYVQGQPLRNIVNPPRTSRA